LRRRSFGRYCVLKLVVLLLFLSVAANAQVLKEDDPELTRINVVEHLGDTISIDLTFVNENGMARSLRNYFGQGIPISLTLAYYECPMLCTLVLNALLKGVKQLEWKPGQQFQMLTISIDPEETPELAKSKKRVYIEQLDKGNIEEGWKFFVGNDSNIAQIASQLGFEYFYDAGRDEFGHPAVVFILTETGVLSRYLYGLEYRPGDLKLALLEASEGKIGNTIDQLLLYCFHYDPQSKGYVLFARNVMKIGGVLTVLLLGTFLGVMWRRDSKKSRKSKQAQLQS